VDANPFVIVAEEVCSGCGPFKARGLLLDFLVRYFLWHVFSSGFNCLPLPIGSAFNIRKQGWG
jgi:hypothetical protein